MNETTIVQYFAEIPDKIRPYALQLYELGRSIGKFDDPSVYFKYSLRLFDAIEGKYISIESTKLNSELILDIPNYIKVDLNTLGYHLSSLSQILHEALDPILKNYNVRDLSNVVNFLKDIEKLRFSFRLGSYIDFQDHIVGSKTTPWKVKSISNN